ncbi:MAG: hypothetical protein ACYCO3_13485 [Mycobacteriales bacterium]
MTFAMPNGTMMQFPEPPPGFSPMTASNSELSAYSLPPRPVPPKASASAQAQEQYQSSLQAWDESMRGVRTFVKPAPCATDIFNRSADTSNPSVVPGTSATNYSQLIWAGISASDAANPNRWRRATGYFVEPTYGPAPNCPVPTNANWTGIGGVFGDGALVQNGVYEDSSTAGNGMPWYEFLHGAGTGGTSIPLTYFATARPIPPGHQVYSSTYYDVGTNYVYFTVIDETSGLTFTAKGNLYAGYYYQGSTAEFIAERTTPFGTKNPTWLSNFGQVTWTGTQVEDYTGTYYWVGNVNHDYFTMVNSAGYDMALASLPASDRVVADYVRCG